MKGKIIVVLPAYNAEKTLKRTVQAITPNTVDEILVVDDFSNDKTVSVAKSLGLRVFKHKTNRGYGANQKTCYKEALKREGEVIVLLHPDYQYNPRHIKFLVDPIREGAFDIMLGSRIRSRQEALANGMPFYKYVSNRFLTLLENLVMGLNLSEYHTGYRAFHKSVLRSLNLSELSDDFVFDQQILIAAHINNFKIGEFFTPGKYRKDSSSINFSRSLKYGLDIILSLFQYIIHKNSFPGVKKRE